MEKIEIKHFCFFEKQKFQDVEFFLHKRIFLHNYIIYRISAWKFLLSDIFLS